MDWLATRLRKISEAMHGKEEEAEAETVPRLEEAQLQLGISETYHPREYIQWGMVCILVIRY